MKQFQALLRQVLEQGTFVPNRTDKSAIFYPGARMVFNLEEEFPAVTTKYLYANPGLGELCGFLRGYTSAADFRALGCNFWNQNANEEAPWLANPFREGEDDLGPIYGAQWRRWPAYLETLATAKKQIQRLQQLGYAERARYKAEAGETIIFFKEVDQVRNCLDILHKDPTSRRALFHGWNVAALDVIAIPPCHFSYYWIPNPVTRQLSLKLFIRSNDLFLGAPMNVLSGAVLLSLFARLTGYTPHLLDYSIGNAHIYENHVEQVKIMLEREPLPAPRLVISDRIPEFAKTGVYEPEWLDKVLPSDFVLEGYQHHGILKGAMAV